jgi:hypothetical protein
LVIYPPSISARASPVPMGVRDRRGACHRSEADARPGADAVLVLKPPSRGQGLTPLARPACSVPHLLRRVAARRGRRAGATARAE